MNIKDVSTSPASLSLCLAHHVVEDEAGVRQFEVFEQTVELPAVQRTPGTVEVVSGLRLLPRVVVVLELNRRKDTRVTAGCLETRAVQNAFFFNQMKRILTVMKVIHQLNRP